MDNINCHNNNSPTNSDSNSKHGQTKRIVSKNISVKPPPQFFPIIDETQMEAIPHLPRDIDWWLWDNFFDNMFCKCCIWYEPKAQLWRVSKNVQDMAIPETVVMNARQQTGYTTLCHVNHSKYYMQSRFTVYIIFTLKLCAFNGV